MMIGLLPESASQNAEREKAVALGPWKTQLQTWCRMQDGELETCCFAVEWGVYQRILLVYQELNVEPKR
jgi:hypothetical protein